MFLPPAGNKLCLRLHRLRFCHCNHCRHRITPSLSLIQIKRRLELADGAGDIAEAVGPVPIKPFGCHLRRCRHAPRALVFRSVHTLVKRQRTDLSLRTSDGCVGCLALPTQRRGEPSVLLPGALTATVLVIAAATSRVRLSLLPCQSRRRERAERPSRRGRWVTERIEQLELPSGALSVRGGHRVLGLYRRAEVVARVVVLQRRGGAVHVACRARRYRASHNPGHVPLGRTPPRSARTLVRPDAERTRGGLHRLHRRDL